VADRGITGVLGQAWRATVTDRGAVVPWDGSSPLDWHVAADDRWHSPSAEAAVRQVRLSGTPVFETRMRVPGGDAVQRVWSVADAGGWTVVEVANESPLPFACAFTREDVWTSRPPAEVPVEGIDLPAGSVVVPVGHRTTATVGLRHSADAKGLPRGYPRADAVARGWLSLSQRASRLDLPEDGPVDAVVAARCDLLLGARPDRDDDPAGFLLSVTELVRLGELDDAAAGALAADVAIAAEQVARHQSWDSAAALDGAAMVLAAAGEPSAVRDVARITVGRTSARLPATPPGGIRAVAAVERRLAQGPVLFPEGIPNPWRGSGIEAHGLAAGPGTRLSFAVRWHGERPAVLWEIEGEAMALSAPAVDPTWRTNEPSGEALWPPVPPGS
jgi:hypothetical protein